MKRLLFLLGLIGVLFMVPGTAFGADGDQCDDSSDADIPLSTRGQWQAVACVQLCDGKAATEECDEYDFADSPGVPDILIFEYQDNSGNCGGTPDLTITTGPVTGGTPSYDISSSTVVLNPTTNRIIVITEGAPLDRFLFTSLADDASCDDLDVRMFFVNRKKGLF